MLSTYSIFKEKKDAGKNILEEKQVTVGEGESKCKGVAVKCDKTECVFEFSVYEYAGKHHPNAERLTPPSGANLGALPEGGGPPMGHGPPLGRGPPRPPPWANGSSAGSSLRPLSEEKHVNQEILFEDTI